MRSLVGKTALLLLAGTGLAGAGAQQVQPLRGTVRDSTANVPLAGVVVAALDSLGGTVARAITDADGRFFLRPQTPVRRLHLIRIGYRPRDVAVNPRDESALRVAMEKLPPILTTVHVTDSELCPGSADRGAAFQLWEQARAGLLATIVSRDLKPASATTLLYESALSPGDERTRRQKKEYKHGQTTRPFVAPAGASYFAEVGYMTEDAGGRLFNAPDADILLHESFAATHCFRLRAADASHRNQFGLAFSPVRGREEIVDVTGVIWIDSVAPKIRSLEFTYTELEPAAVQARAGGYLQFRTMPNGVSFIERWHLRLPVLQVAASSSNPVRRDGRPPRRQDRFDLRVTEVVESGGIVLDAEWDDGQAFHDPASTVTGKVARRNTNEPARFAIVTLAGTPDTSLTDTTGRFEIRTIPGKYTVVATDTLLRAFVAPRTERRNVDIAHGATLTMAIEVAPVTDVVNGICRGQVMRDSAVILIGYVWGADAPLLRHASVRANWQDNFARGAISGLTGTVRETETELDDEGRFVVCGVARERPVRLQLRQGSARLADTTVRVFTSGLTMPVVWRVGPPSPPHPDADGANGLGRPDEGPATCHTRCVTSSLVSQGATGMSERNKTHNGRDVDGHFRVRSADVDEILEDPAGPDIVRDDVRLGGAIADVGPQAGLHGRHIAEVIQENQEDIGRVTGGKSSRKKR
jgi:hypothetical protein